MNDPSTHLPIRDHTILDASGRMVRRQNVFCPFRGRSIPVEDCTECYDCESVVPNSAGRVAFVVCRRLAAEAEEAPEGAPAGSQRALAEPVSTAALAELICVEPDVPASALAEVLIEHRVDAAAVVDRRGHPIGVVSKTDLVRGSIDGRGAKPKPLEQGEADRRGTAGAIMTPVVHSVRETTRLGQAVALMAAEAIHQLPVVSDDGRVVAMLSTRDVMQAIARAEGFAVPEQSL